MTGIGESVVRSQRVVDAVHGEPLAYERSDGLHQHRRIRRDETTSVNVENRDGTGQLGGAAETVTGQMNHRRRPK